MKTKKIAIALAAVAMLFTASCGGNKKADAEAAQTETAQDSIMEVDAVLAQPDSLVGKTLKVEGICFHVCQHGQKKMHMMGNDSTKILLVMAAEGDKFKEEYTNSIVSIEGKLVEHKTYMEDIDKQEAQVKAQQSEEQQRHGEAGCEASKKANGLKGNTFAERFAEQRQKISDREAKEGKAYLSTFYIVAEKHAAK